MEIEFRDYLIANPAIAGLVGQRVFWGVRDTATPYPAIVLNRAGGTVQQKYKGQDGLARARVQIDIYSDNFAQIKAVEKALKSALLPQNFAPNAILKRVFIETDRGDTSADGVTATRIYRNSADYSIFYSSGD